MQVRLSLFGAFRDYEPDAVVALDLPGGAHVSDLRAALERYGVAHWPAFSTALLQRSAFASEATILRDNDPLPDDGRMAVLPPVSGG